MKGLKEISALSYKLSRESTHPCQEINLPVYYANDTLYSDKAKGEYLLTIKYWFSDIHILELATNALIDPSGEYKLTHTWQGWTISKKSGNSTLYLSKVYKGSYTWYSDYLYEKAFSYKTAVKHIKNIIEEERQEKK